MNGECYSKRLCPSIHPAKQYLYISELWVSNFYFKLLDFPPQEKVRFQEIPKIPSSCPNNSTVVSISPERSKDSRNTSG